MRKGSLIEYDGFSSLVEKLLVKRRLESPKRRARRDLLITDLLIIINGAGFIMKNIILVFSVCIVSYQFSFSQNTDDRFPLKPDREIRQPYCEFNVPELEKIATKIGSNKYLIIVSHPEKAERKSISSRRLYNAKEFFMSSPYNRPKGSILIAEGEPITGYGYVDFFVEGKLELRIHVNKNAELVVTACVIDPPTSRCSNSHELLFYPCLSEKKSMR